MNGISNDWKVSLWSFPIVGILAALVFQSLELRAADAGPVILDPAVLIEGATADIRYHAQPAKDGRIDLTANNGFFDRCFEAADQGKAIPGDAAFICASFGHLQRFSEGGGTARWHLWCAEAGTITAEFFMEVPASETNHVWTITAGGESKALVAHASDGASPQKQVLTFDVKEPGKVTFAFDCTMNPPAAATRIRSIRLTGSAIAKAHLLRTRWRPRAVHTYFHAPTNCPSPQMWVFETVDVARTGSYSPLTTPFGYFGTVLRKGGVIPAGSGFNFSMWIAGRDATNAPPLPRMARLIGTDIADAKYDTFGGEGTGVKFRASAYSQDATRTIQALRIEADADGLRTFYGYFYDEPAGRWRLYASAQKPGPRPRAAGTNAATMRGTGSFCEIPGPPNRERSGDVVREIKRRGWFLGSDQKWYRAQLGGGDPIDGQDSEVERPAAGADEKPAKKARRRGGDKESFSDQRSFYMDDYATEGWMAMATGGMELYRIGTGNPARTKTDARLTMPDYLSPEETAQLFELPVRFGVSKATDISADRATIEYEIAKTGPNSRAVLYFGTVDCLTFPAQGVTKGSPAQIDMHRPERTWQHATPEQNISVGSNTLRLAGLKGGTTYFYRLFVKHDAGKSWDYVSGNFETAK